MLPLSVRAQEQFGGTVEFDSTVHDFGDVLLSDGPLSCEFSMKNIGSKPVVIYNVTTSCGCTDAKWPKEPIAPGQTATISTTYTNEEDYPFDKTITVYVSDVNRPILLKIRGVTHKEIESLESMFPMRFGQAGLKKTELKCGNMEMGESRSDAVQVANLSDSPLSLSFTDLTDGLSVKVSPNPVPARSTATLTYTVTSRNGVWGKNRYFATPVVAGRKYADGIVVEAFTKENFSSMTPEEKKNAPTPMFTSSTWSMGKVSAGTVITANWEFENTGKSAFRTYKVDIDSDRATHTEVPEVAPGGKGNFSVTLDTTGMPTGEALVIVTLTTNSPSRPIVNLFITGWIE